MKITFIDSGVLMAAARGNEKLSNQALKILGSVSRQFATSQFIKLEVLPNATYHRKQEIVEFYETYFQNVTIWAEDLAKVTQKGYEIACKHGLAGMDAMHIAAAIQVRAEEFITTEKSTKPMFRVPGIKVISLFELNQDIGVNGTNPEFDQD